MRLSSLSQCLFFVLGTPFLVDAAICDDCDRACGWLDFGCSSSVFLCQTSGALYRGVVGTMELGCSDTLATSNQDTERVEQAFRSLIRLGFLTPERADSLDVRICPLIGVGVDGLVTNPNSIFLDDTTRSYDDVDFAVLLAKQLQRVEQIDRWGLAGHACRYSEALATGNGFGMGNAVEREVIKFGNRVRLCLVSRVDCAVPIGGIDFPPPPSPLVGGIVFPPPPPPPTGDLLLLPPTPTWQFPPLPSPTAPSGGCGRSSFCFINEQCCGNQCTNVVDSIMNCGSCGAMCPFNTVCRGGRCFSTDSSWLP